MRIVPTVIAAALTLTVTGCGANFHTAGKNTAETSLVGAEADASLATMRAGKVSTPGFELVEDQDYVPAKPKRIARANSLPSRCDIEFSPAGPVTLLEVGQQITKDCGIQVRVTADAVSALDGTTPATSAPTTAAPPTLIPPLIGGAGSMGGYAAPRNDTVSVSYKGDVSGLLNAVTTRLGLSWKYIEGGITIFHLDTRTFRLFNIPTATAMTSTVTSGNSTSIGTSGGTGGDGASGTNSGVSGSSGTQQSTTVSLETKPDEDLRKTVESMLTPGKGRVAYSRSTSLLSVTDTPEVLDRVAALIDDLNDSATTQVLLNIKVISVTLSDSDEFGIDWTTVYTNLAKDYGLGLSNSFQSSAAAVSASVSILQGDSRFSGSNLIVKALQQQGHVSMVTQPSVTTLNMEPVPVQVATQEDIVAATQTTLSGGTSDFAQVNRTTKTITSGFNMNLLPYVLPDADTVLLQFSMQMASPPRLRTVGSDDNSQELATQASRTFSQKVKLKSGETLILSGFEQTANDTNRSGVGNPRNYLFGGGRKSTRNREVIVILITPLVQA
jgi:type IVB pilus formation R64 PilN family outer membrane protein